MCIRDSLQTTEAAGDFRVRFAMQSLTDGFTRNKLEHVLRTVRHQNSADALVHALQLEAAMSASGSSSHKVHAR